MSQAATLRWLADFQACFGAAIRTPLDRSTGTLRACPSSYEAALCQAIRTGALLPASASLAVYNRQYWFRLFGVLQSEFPLTALLLGYWHFNDYAAQFLTAQAPSGFDICSAADGFAAFLGSHQVAGSSAERAGDFALPSEALQQAAAIDEALRQAICAKAQAPLQLDPAQAASLACSRLIPRPGLSLIYEQWPLMDLRISLSRGSESATAKKQPVLPTPLPAPQYWAVFPTQLGTGQLMLTARQAQLYQLLCTRTVATALAVLEQDCSEIENNNLPLLVQKWLAQSMELGLWCNAVPTTEGEAECHLQHS